MIKGIRLKNVALIESAEIDFFNGLNVLSGETGAGKTVIISAINFALGAKADKTMIRFGETYSEAEVCFAVQKNSEAASILDEYSIDFDDEIVIKRKLTIDGRSDVRINGSSVTLSMLKRVTNSLCDVYGQSEHYSLLSSANQLKVLDGYIGEPLALLKSQAEPIINKIKTAQKTLESSGGDERSRAVRLDVLSYQISEIEKAELQEGEEDELLAKRVAFLNAGKIGEGLSVVNQALYGDGGASDIISTAISKLGQITSFSNDYEELYDRLYSLKAEADDIASTADSLLSDIDFDEREFNRIEDRLDLIKTLKRKYGSSYEEIMEFYSKSLIEYENLRNFEELSKSLETDITNGFIALNSIYDKMFNLRKDYAQKFSLDVERELATLGMKSAKFKIEVTRNDKELSLDGNSEALFTFSANAGEPLKNMSKIISGGEMSRFMLALKIVSSPIGGTYIFDEIDAGISGEVAKIVAEKFVKLSKGVQIITISHLPQIVSYGDNNYLIKKTDDGVKTVTNVNMLNYEGKVLELMRLAGGLNSDVSRLHAVESIERAENFKKSL